MINDEGELVTRYSMTSCVAYIHAILCGEFLLEAANISLYSSPQSAELRGLHFINFLFPLMMNMKKSVVGRYNGTSDMQHLTCYDKIMILLSKH